MENENKQTETKTRNRKKDDRSRLLRRLTLTAMFTAFAVVIKCFTKAALTIPGIGVQISFGGIFTFFPAILFGPLYGGAASALVDFLGAMIAPTGAYIPLLTVSAFLGGCIKGLVWQLLRRGVGKRTRAVLLALVVLVGGMGVANMLSLHADGVTSGFFVRQKDVPVRTEVARMEKDGELGVLSRLTVRLAQYNKDSFTLTKAEIPADVAFPEVENFYVPLAGQLTLGEQSYTVKKIGSGALTSLAETLARNGVGLYIGKSFTTIADDAIGKNSVTENMRILGETGSAAEKFAAVNGFVFEAADDAGANSTAFTVVGTYEQTHGTTVTAEGGGIGMQYTFRSSDTYRKYLAGYANLATAGLVLFSALTLCLCGVVWLLGKRRVEKALSAGPDRLSYLRILMSILASGLVVTTINTFILRIFLPAYAGRAVLLLWIPRACEELVVCVIQAYLISLLYSVIMRGRLGTIIGKL